MKQECDESRWHVLEETKLWGLLECLVTRLYHADTGLDRILCDIPSPHTSRAQTGFKEISPAKSKQKWLKMRARERWEWAPKGEKMSAALSPQVAPSSSLHGFLEPRRSARTARILLPRSEAVIMIET